MYKIRQRGLAGIAMLAILVTIIAVAVYFLSSDETIKKQAMLKAASVAGDIASGVMERSDQLENVPVEVKQINDFIFQARGIGNTHVIATSEGNVLFDSGLSIQAAKQIEVLKAVIPDAALTHIILSHSHADHIGGAHFWQEQDTLLITHEQFSEEQRYLKELDLFQWGRNRMMFPFLPEEPVQGGMFGYRLHQPDITVDDYQVYKFEQGGVRFEVYGTPGAEGADNIVLWLPDHKILFSGDTFGPMFPQFPNIFTARGEKVRKPIEYVRSLDLIIALAPDMVVPSHFSPVIGAEKVMHGLVSMRNAVQHVHDEVVAGMNGGKSVYELMDEVELPEGSKHLTQGHGRVSWAVKSIWEYYATWFYSESTTELYSVPVREIYADLAEIGGVDTLLDRAEQYLSENKKLRSLHLLEVALAGDSNNRRGLILQQRVLEQMHREAVEGLNNTYEVIWLNNQIIKIKENLESPSGHDS